MLVCNPGPSARDHIPPDLPPDPNVGTSNYRRRGYPPEPLRLPEFQQAGMNGLNDHERKVIIEFCHLLEKSKQLFNGLRAFPRYGHKQWTTYFGRTFDVYTKLWKFQQQHRDVLDVKYGLKRWQIGEIASKIGQLYYHFYLRTSDTAYLNEAFSFYYAIRGRSYYTKAIKEDRPDLMVKKLRYYARFLVVGLLLNKIKLVRELIKELDSQIIDYGSYYDPLDQEEWNTVADEVKSFVKADPVVVVTSSEGYPIVISHRLNKLAIPPVEKSSLMTLSLHEVYIIGGCADQVNFSELTIDMFRILQAMEREITEEQMPNTLFDTSPRSRGFPSTPAAPTARGNIEPAVRRDANPHKHLLYKPSVNEVLVYMASGSNDLPPNGALMLYISADGYFAPNSSKSPEDSGYEIGGVIPSSRTVIQIDKKDGKVSKFKESQCLHPGDLLPMTRRPLFVIVDSENSYVFQNVPRLFGQPSVIFMSPVELPSPYHEMHRTGSLFTMFLYSPLSAFCVVSDVPSLNVNDWDRGQAIIERFLAEASKMMTRSRSLDMNYMAFMGDDFLRVMILRYIFCEVVLRAHRSFRARTHLPRASPPLPEGDVLEQATLHQIVLDLVCHLDAKHLFQESIGESRGLREVAAAKE